jgi:hypothetical protein
LTETEQSPRQASPSPDGAFKPLRSLAETQLAIQFSLAGTYDAQATGILGLDAALAAAAIAGDRLLGQLWWLALIGLLLSGICCVAILFTRLNQMGPRTESLIGDAEDLSDREMERLMFESLDGSIKRNDHELEGKSDLVLIAILILSLTIFGAIIGVLAS